MRISEMPVVLLRCLIITIVVECGMAIILGYRKRDLLNVLLVNVLTNPLLNSLVIYVNVYYGLKWRSITLYTLEVIALLVEGLIYQKYLEKRKLNGYLLSLILNISSYVIGLIINYIIY